MNADFHFYEERPAIREVFLLKTIEPPRKKPRIPLVDRFAHYSGSYFHYKHNKFFIMEVCRF